MILRAGCDFQLHEARAVSITGASGSGKSTLLNILGGLDWPTAGEVLYRGEALDYQNEPRLIRWRARGVGFVFQFHFLLPDFTALENLLIPVRAQGAISGEDRQRAEHLLEVMGLGDRLDHLPGELSGGEQQRVAMARAFMNRPEVILADEPFGNLDKRIGERLAGQLFDLRHQEKTSLVVVTHDDRLAGLADHQLHLEDGILHEVG